MNCEIRLLSIYWEVRCKKMILSLILFYTPPGRKVENKNPEYKIPDFSHYSPTPALYRIQNIEYRIMNNTIENRLR